MDKAGVHSPSRRNAAKHGWCPAFADRAPRALQCVTTSDRDGKRLILPAGPFNAKAFPDAPDDLARSRGSTARP
jgi:hypothetical protein